MIQRASPSVGTIQDGYRFKGGDPAQESSWEQVAPVAATGYGAGVMQDVEGGLYRSGRDGQRIEVPGGQRATGQSTGLVGADARARFMTGLGPLRDAQNNFAASERGPEGRVNPINRDWGAALIDGISENPVTKNIGDATARWIGGDDYQRFSQARSTYESSLLPILSGAAVTPSEAERLIRADIPQWNDTPETLARKERNRAQRINAVAQGIGQEAPFNLDQAAQDDAVNIAGMSAQDLLNLTPGTKIRLPDGSVQTLSGSPSVGREGREVSPGVYANETPAGAVAERERAPDLWRNIDGAVRGAADTLSFGYADEIAAAGDAAIGRGQGDSFGDRFRSNRNVQTAIDQADSRAIPAARFGGQFAGAFAAPGAGAAGRFVANAPNVAGAALRGAGVGGLFGAAYGSGNATDDRLGGAAAGGLAGAATGGALSGVTRGVGAAARGLFGGSQARRSDADILAASGVFTTPGARAGGLGKSLEDLSMRAPIMGSAVRGARDRSVESLNRAVGNRALSNIGEGLPATTSAGAESVDYVARQLGQQFDRAADMVPSVAPDEPFFQNLARISQGMTDLPESSGRQFQSILQDRLSRLSGPVTGKQLRQIESEIGDLSSSVEDQQLSRMLAGVRDELQDLLGRTNPEAGQILQRARAGYREFATMRQASQAAGGNVFTPSQLLTAVRSTDQTVGNGATARGRAPLQDLARAAKNVIPDGYGNPGTADALGYGSLAALGVTNPPAAAMAAGGLAGAATPYWMMGREIVESLPANPSPQQTEEALSRLGALAQNDPSIQQLIRYVLNTGQVVVPGAIGAAQAQ